jgi:hypothetical protein
LSVKTLAASRTVISGVTDITLQVITSDARMESLPGGCVRGIARALIIAPEYPHVSLSSSYLTLGFGRAQRFDMDQLYDTPCAIELFWPRIVGAHSRQHCGSTVRYFQFR